MISGLVLYPNVLYFLGINCNQALKLEGTSATGSMSALLEGLTSPDPVLPVPVASNLSVAHGFSFHNLPNPFGTPTIGTGDILNVYVSNP
jgi:hypothetical protein